MAWPLGGMYSVCVDEFLNQEKVIDMDCDEYGSPKMELRHGVKEWFKDLTFDAEWWVDDIGNIWFEFETRGEAMMFVLECL